MRIILTNHARTRAIQRGISFAEIVDTILAPDNIEEQDDTISCYKKLWQEHLLLIYAKDSQWNKIVITALKTSKIGKYLKD